MTSLGLGEILIIILLLLVSFDIKQIGKALKWLSSIRNKFYQMQSDFRYQFSNLMAQEEAKEELEKIYSSPEEMRNWGAKQVRRYSRVRKIEAAAAIMEQFGTFAPYLEARSIAAYSSLHDELITTDILKKILADGKTLYLPYIRKQQMLFAEIKDLEKDTAPGIFGILEPIEPLHTPPPENPQMYLVPGRTFDESGGRIGRGKGYYDRYFANHPGCRVGICLDSQISHKKLPLRKHDQNMDYVISEKRIISAKIKKAE